MKILPDISRTGLTSPCAGNYLYLKGRIQTMCERIWARIHVYEIKAAALPAISSQGTVDEQ
jgi:hypothetical protein